VGNAVGQISKQAMEEVVELMQQFLWLILHNNVQILFCVFSQHLDNQGKFGTGTAATVYIKRNTTPLSESANHDLTKCCATGLLNPPMEMDILDLID
jgi:hypothetical protein